MRVSKYLSNKHTVCGITARISSMCVSKHSSWMNPRVSRRIENALIRTNFSSHKRESILVAAHLPMFRVRVRISFPIHTIPTLKEKTLEFLVPGSFEFCDLTELNITPLKRSRNAWNTIHATIRM